VQNLSKQANLYPAALQFNLPLAKLLVNSLGIPIELLPYKGVARTGCLLSLQLVAIFLTKLLLLLHNITCKYTYTALLMLHLH
jgi:hypothetical protein